MGMEDNFFSGAFAAGVPREAEFGALRRGGQAPPSHAGQGFGGFELSAVFREENLEFVHAAAVLAPGRTWISNASLRSGQWGSTEENPPPKKARKKRLPDTRPATVVGLDILVPN